MSEDPHAQASQILDREMSRVLLLGYGIPPSTCRDLFALLTNPQGNYIPDQLREAARELSMSANQLKDILVATRRAVDQMSQAASAGTVYAEQLRALADQVREPPPSHRTKFGRRGYNSSRDRIIT